jgi:hypothetical protein
MHTIGGSFDGVDVNTHWEHDGRWLVAHDIAISRRSASRTAMVT